MGVFIGLKSNESKSIGKRERGEKKTKRRRGKRNDLIITINT